MVTLEEKHDGQWQTIRLQNDQISLDILPELGGKIYDLYHRPSGKNLLWHPPAAQLAATEFGASYDDHWTGGWDEVVPNDPPVAISGKQLVDHGEVWGQPARCEILRNDSQECQLRLTTDGRLWPTRFERTLTLRADDSYVRIAYAFTNLAPHPIDFLWNIHPAMAISPYTRVDVPAAGGVFDPFSEPRFKGNSPFSWPSATDQQGRSVDMRRVDPPEARVADMCYLTNVTQGWYAVTDQQARVGFALAFPTSVFKHVWLFRTFGGWRDFYTLIPEAAIGYPSDLTTAIQNGTCGHLEAGQTLSAEVKAIVYDGVTSVANIDSNGHIMPG